MDFLLSSIIFSQQIYILEMREKRGGEGFTSHAGVLLSPMSHYHNRDVWTFLKLMLMIEHMKMMQMPYLDIRSMLLSGQVPHRTNSSQLFWNGLFQKKEPNREGGWWHTFLKKPLELFWLFSVPLEISGKTKLHPWKFSQKETLKSSTPENLVKYVCYTPWKFQGQKPRPLEISHKSFLISLWYSTFFSIHSWKFCMLFIEYSRKFYHLHLNSPISKTMC